MYSCAFRIFSHVLCIGTRVIRVPLRLQNGIGDFFFLKIICKVQTTQFYNLIQFDDLIGTQCPIVPVYLVYLVGKGICFHVQNMNTPERRVNYISYI